MSASGGYDKSVKGGTKSKLAAPKSKYVQHLLEATRSGESAIGEVFRSLQYRLKDPTWTIVFKSLILTHMLIRDGYKDSVLDYLSTSHQFRVTAFTSTGCSPMSEQGQNISDYGSYLTARVKSFSNVKKDFVKSKSDREGQGRLRNLSVDKGLLRETESVQKLITPLIKCRMLENDVDNEITLTAFRLLVADLLILFQVANEGVINVLEHYFEMSRPDAERALNIYKKFVEQTDGVIIYMSLARSLESVTRLEIPNLQHAPTSLGNSLEEYINDPDFEQNRLQYLAQKSGGKAPAAGSAKASSEPTSSNGGNGLRSALKKNTDTNPFGAPQLPAPNTGNADLLDFFDTLEPQQQQQQQTQQYQQQAVGFNQNVQQQSQMNGANPYMTSQQQIQAQMGGIQPQYTNSFQAAPAQQSYSGYTNQQSSAFQQPATQQQYPPQQQFVQQQTTAYNPYNNPSQGQGQSQANPLQPSATSSSLFNTTSLQPQATGANPFRRSMMPMATGMSTAGMMAPQVTGGNPFSRGPPSNGTPLNMPSSAQSYQAPQMQTQTTGNPFAKSRVVSDPMAFNNSPQNAVQMNMTGSMMPQQTGTSNPFRKSMMPMSAPQQSFGGR